MKNNKNNINKSDDDSFEELQDFDEDIIRTNNEADDEDLEFNDDRFEEDFGEEFDEEFDDDNDDQAPDAKERKKEYYVKGADLIAEIRKYQESKKASKDGRGIISEELGLMILKICTRFSMHPRFYGYSYRDDFVADAVARCIAHSLDRIDLSHPKCNPFSYLTQTAYNVFRQKIKSEKRIMQTKQDYRERYYDAFEITNGIRHTQENPDELSSSSSNDDED